MKDYSKIAKPLNDLLGEPKKKRGRVSKNNPPKQSPFVWGADQQQAFDALKEALTTAPILAYPDFTKPFKLHTDASGAGLGAVLYQEFDGKEHVIAYASRGLKASEKNYPAHKLEFLALKWSVCHKFHEYLYGNKFEVLTDNNPLTYVLTTAKLDATGHQWLAELSLYDFSIKYRPGLKNGDADGLSRRSIITENEVHSICNGILAQEPPQVGIIQVSKVQTVNWKMRQNADKAIKLIASFVEKGRKPPYRERSSLPEETKSLLRDFDMLMVADGVLYHKQQRDGQEVYQLILPKEYRKTALEGLHDNAGH